MSPREIRWERGPGGRLFGWLSRGGDRVRLRQCADLVQERFAGEARDRVFGGELAFWDFLVGGVLITVHLDSAVGIAVLANDTDPKSEALVREIAEQLVLAGAC